MTVQLPKKTSDAKTQSYIDQGSSKESQSLETTAKEANSELRTKPSFNNSVLLNLIETRPTLLQVQEEIDRIRDWIADDYLVLGDLDLKLLAKLLKVPNLSLFSSFIALLEPMLENRHTSERAASIIIELLKDSRASARYAALEVISSQLGNIDIAGKLLEQAEEIMSNEEISYIVEYLQCLTSGMEST
jgi:hypothetical protein